MNSVKEKLSIELAAVLVSALYEEFPEVPPYSYMFPHGACSMSGFVVDKVFPSSLPDSIQATVR